MGTRHDTTGRLSGVIVIGRCDERRVARQRNYSATVAAYTVDR
jgi:hypothetical protein